MGNVKLIWVVVPAVALVAGLIHATDTESPAEAPDTEKAEARAMARDIAWGIRELRHREDDPLERRRLMAAFRELNKDVIAQERMLSATAAARRFEVSPVLRRQPVLDGRTEDEAEAVTLRMRIAEALRETREQAGGVEDRRGAMFHARSDLEESVRRERELAGKIRTAGVLAASEAPEVERAAPLRAGTVEETDWRGVRDSLADALHAIRESTRDPEARRARVSAWRIENAAIIERERHLAAAVRRQISAAETAGQSPGTHPLLEPDS